ncbi:MAG: hypothetical protein ABFD50_15430 [Smithella sp.]
MTPEQLERGKMLRNQIDVLECAVRDMKKWVEEPKRDLYSLYISRYADRSGHSINLSGVPAFNERIAKTILTSLESELTAIRKEFESI